MSPSLDVLKMSFANSFSVHAARHWNYLSENVFFMKEIAFKSRGNTIQSKKIWPNYFNDPKVTKSYGKYKLCKES